VILPRGVCLVCGYRHWSYDTVLRCPKAGKVRTVNWVGDSKDRRRLGLWVPTSKIHSIGQIEWWMKNWREVLRKVQARGLDRGVYA